MTIEHDDEMRDLVQDLFSIAKRLHQEYCPPLSVEELTRRLEEGKYRPENDPGYLDYLERVAERYLAAN